MDPLKETVRAETRRQFFGTAARGIGGLALASLFAEDAFALPLPGTASAACPICRTSRRRRSSASTST